MKPRKIDYTDEEGNVDFEAYYEDLDGYGEYMYELERDRKLEEEIEKDEQERGVRKIVQDEEE